MTKNQAAKKYSRALISIFELSDIPGVIEELIVFSKLIDGDKKLRLLFASRIFSEDEKNRALKSLLSRLKASALTEKFLKLIITGGHLSAMKEIIKAAIESYNEKLKKTTALVISPVTLQAEHISRLKAALKGLTSRDVDLESRIDPSLLGGFIVKVGSTIYDSSLKGQFRLLKSELLKDIRMN